MTVRLTSAVLGQAVGYAYTGPLESWLLNEGYATSAATIPDAWAADSNGVPGAAAPTVTVTPTAAVLVGSANAAATVGADGSVVFATKGGVRTTVALLTADTAAQAATKIDTALAGLADAAIVSSKLQVTSIATGPSAYIVVVSGTAAVLTALHLAVGQTVYGGDGRPVGASNIGVQADLPENDPSSAANREAPYFEKTPDLHYSIANDVDHLTDTSNPAPGFDFDADDVDTEAPSDITLEPAEGVEGDFIRVLGRNLEGVTDVTFDTVSATSIDDDAAGDGVLVVEVPAGTAGPANVVLEDPSGDTTLTAGFTYTA